MAREEIIFTAQEARINSNSSFGSLKRIFKLIKERSKENEVGITYSFNSISQRSAQMIITTLVQNGYNVTVKRYDKEAEDEIEVEKITEDLKDATFIIDW